MLHLVAMDNIGVESLEHRSKPRVMVDMSATIIHHGHIRLLKKASELGVVVVGLTTDDEILKTKGYFPELNFSAREEIVASVRYVCEVVPVPWLVDLQVLARHDIDFLVHGEDNRNPVPAEKTIIFPRTPGVSSSDLREKTLLLNAAWRTANRAVQAV